MAHQPSSLRSETVTFTFAPPAPGNDTSPCASASSCPPCECWSEKVCACAAGAKTSSAAMAIAARVPPMAPSLRGASLAFPCLYACEPLDGADQGAPRGDLLVVDQVVLAREDLDGHARAVALQQRGGLADALDRDPAVGIARAEVGRRPAEAGAHDRRGPRRPDEAAGVEQQAPVAARVADRVLGGQARALGEASEDEPRR